MKIRNFLIKFLILTDYLLSNCFIFMSMLAFYLFLSGCSEKSEKKPTVDNCGDIKPAIFHIINGTSSFDPTVVNLTPSQVKAVGALFINFGNAMCSATLIAPNVVLTAAHCVSGSIYNITFVGGEDLRNPEFTFRATQWHVHPDFRWNPPEYDIGVVIIDGDTASAGITPITVNCEPTRLLTKVVQAVGYGATSSSGGFNTRRWWTTLTVLRETPNYYSAYDDDSGTCQGDSGGPMLYTMPDGLPHVMGVVSSGDSENCLGNTYYPRTDFYCDFIQQFLPPVDPCEGETMAGRCDGSMAIWCENQQIYREDCSAEGKICSSDSNGNFRCVLPPDPCEGETFEGRCDGQVAIWCENETVMRVQCDAGQLCGTTEDGLWRCVDECALIGMTGRCDENGNARWCQDGVIKVRDCVLCGQTCGWIDDTMGYYCL